MATQTEQMIENTRMNGAVFRWINDHGNQGLIVTDEQLRIRIWNHWLETKTHKHAEEIIGLSLLEVFPELVTRQLDRYFRQALEGRSNVLSQKLHKFLIEVPASELDVEPMRQSVRISPLEEADNVIGTVTVIDDVTERVNREAILQRQLAQRAKLLESESAARSAAEAANTRLSNLQTITDEAFAQHSLNDVLFKIVQGVRAVLNTATVVLLMADDRGDLIVRAIDGIEREAVLGIRVPTGTGFAGMVASERKPVSVKGKLPPSPLNIVLEARGIRALSGIPLVIENHVLGVIHVGMKEMRSLSDEDIRFLRLVGDRASLLIERARSYESEKIARAYAEQANRLKDQFLATVSHELRTPLNAILGWARLLQSGRIDQGTAVHALEVIERNAKAQAQLIDDLLDVSRIISGKLRLNLSPVETAPLVEAALDAVRPAADAKGIRLRTNISVHVGPIPGDPDRIQQIVWNLLSNAIKFTPNEGEVFVSVDRDHSNVEITVRDTGLGIRPEFLPFVFDRFRQADSSVTRTHSGLGLGLAIVRHLVELHGGTVHAESDGENQGATFKVCFPVLGAKLEDVDHDDPSLKTDMSSAIPFDDLNSLQGLHILIVDDDRDSLDLLVTVLQQCGAQVVTAGSASEGLDLISNAKPDIVISDIEMPNEDGYAFMRKLRALPANQGGQIPSVALTAHAKAEDRMRALAAGFHIHVPKPVEPAELLVAIKSLRERNVKSVADG
ncbi:MAG TPA: ATP-binding protein [Pyrinomonadaceae bacterium]|nr:ATP-binding protein [Pyrinomonadaceae bacterium]